MSIQTPIYCDLTVLDESECQEHIRNSKSIFTAINDIKEMSDGYAFGIPNRTDTIIRTGAFMARERLCCPFFHFELEMEPNHGGIWLKVGGQKEVKQYIKENVLPTVKSAMK